MIDFIHKDAYWQDSIDKQLKIELEDGTIIDNSMIYSEEFELEENLCSDDTLRFGSCEASCVKFRIFAIPNSLVSQKINISEAVGGQTDNPMQIGKYKIASATPTADRDCIDIVAYDSMYDIIHSDVAEWYNNQFNATTTTETDTDGNTVTTTTYSTTTLKNFRDSFFSHFGIEQVSIDLPNDNMIVSKTIEIVPDSNGVIGEILPGSSVIEAICEINGCFGHINRDGKFEYVFLQPIAKELFPSDDLFPSNDLFPASDNVGVVIYNWQYEPVEYEDYDVQPITKVQITQEENDIGITVGKDGNKYIVDSNFLTYSLSDEELKTVGTNILSEVQKVKYTPIKANVIGNPCVMLGDIIKIVTNTKILYSYVLNRSLIGCQSITDDIEAKGEEYRSVDVNSTNAQIKKLQGRSNVLERSIDETRSTITNVKRGLKSEIKQTSESITQEIENRKSEDNVLSSKIEQTAESITSVIAKSTIQWDTENVSISEYGYGLDGSETGSYYVFSKTLGRGGIYLDQETGYGWTCGDIRTIGGKTAAILGYRPSHVFNLKTTELDSKIDQTAEKITSTIAKSQSKWDTSNYPVYGKKPTPGYGAPDSSAPEDYLDVSTGAMYHNGTQIGKAKEIKGVLQSSIEQNAGSITAEVSRATEAEGELSSKIEQTAESITSNVAKNTVEWDVSVPNSSIDKAGYSSPTFGNVEGKAVYFWYSETATVGTYYLDQAHGKLYKCTRIGEIDEKKVAISEVYISLDKKTTLLSSEIKQTADSVAISVSENGDIVTSLTTDRNGFSFVGNKIVIDTENLRLDSEGKAVFSGEVVSESRFATATLSDSELEFEALQGTGGGKILIGAVGVEGSKVVYGFGISSDDGIYIGTETNGNFEEYYRVNTSGDSVNVGSSSLESWGKTTAMHIFKEDAYFRDEVYVNGALKLNDAIEFSTYDSIGEGRIYCNSSGKIFVNGGLDVEDGYLEVENRIYVGGDDVIIGDEGGRVKCNSLYVTGDAEVTENLSIWGEISSVQGIRYAADSGSSIGFKYYGGSLYAVINGAEIKLSTA